MSLFSSEYSKIIKSGRFLRLLIFKMVPSEWLTNERILLESLKSTSTITRLFLVNTNFLEIKILCHFK